MRLRLIRHASLVIELATSRLLVDPQLDPPEARPAVDGTANEKRNPLVALPEPATRFVEGAHAALVTHLHTDHLDSTAVDLLPWGLPLIVQPEDETALTDQGFTRVHPVGREFEFEGITIARTAGRHGRGEIGDAMAPVSGFVLRAPGEPVVYIAGDTIWCEEVAAALEEHRPDVVVVNAGSAQFLEGGPITMTADDVAETARAAPGAMIVVVHLEAVNHCLEDRATLAGALSGAGLSERVRIPLDGEWIEHP